MILSDKILMAILKTVPKEKDILSFQDFDKELELIGVNKSSKEYNFLFDSNLLEISESQFKPIHPNKGLNIKMSGAIKYVSLADNGQVLLWSLQSDLLREQFHELKGETV